MRIKVMVFGEIAKTLGREIMMDIPSGATVGDLLAKLGLRSELPICDAPSDKDPNQGFIVLVGGLNIRFLEKNRTRLREGDTVSILPPAGGG